MKKVFLLVLTILLNISFLYAQNSSVDISKNEIERFVNVLASDSLQGRKIFTPGIQKAANLISSEFEKIGLEKWDGLDSYYQAFNLRSIEPKKVDVRWNGNKISKDNILELSVQKKIHWRDNQELQVDKLTNVQEFKKHFRSYLNSEEDRLVWVDESLKKIFFNLKGYFSGQPGFSNKPNVIFVLAKNPPKKFSIKIENKVSVQKTANIVGYLPGTEKSDEYVIFSSHYDHLGIDTGLVGDQIYNGANDDASGTAAVMALAKYFKKQGGNARSLIFVTFTGEEEGGYGSKYFSGQLDPEKIVAMYNIEMIGTPAKWGENTAYITGFDKSNFGKILQKNLQSSDFSFHPDPYPNQHLFYRSDNATLARLGVPAHTVSTAKMKNEPHYHKVSDEINTVDFDNMAQIIKAIAISSRSIISGEDTPTRVAPASLR